MAGPAIALHDLPVLLDPGWSATQPMPPATGTKFRPRPKYFRGTATGKLYFRDDEGTFFEVSGASGSLESAWPIELVCDGEKQFAVISPYAEPPKRAADRHKRYRERRRSLRQPAKLGPADFDQACGSALP